MSKRVRFIIVILVLVVAGVFLYPTYNWYFAVPESKKDLATSSLDAIRNYSRSKASNDLEELKSEVLEDSEAALPEGFAFLKQAAVENYKTLGKKVPEPLNTTAVLASFRDEEALYEYLEGYYRDQLLKLKDAGENILQLGLDLSGGMNVLLRVDTSTLEERLGRAPTDEEREEAVSQAMEILNNRIDRFGVTEPKIRRQGENRIAVEIPGAADPARVRTFLSGRGSLTFNIVDKEQSQEVEAYMSENPGTIVTEDGKIQGADIIDAGYVIRGMYEKDPYGIDQFVRWVVIEKEVGLDGSHIRDAEVGSHPITAQPVINFQLDNEGSEIFFQLTSEHTNETVAVVLDEKVKAMAVINEPIPDNVQMSGFDRNEATDLAKVLRTAALPVNLIVESKQAIGASLGEDSIRMGLKAITVGFILVIIFMLFYYLGAGIIADIALILNLVFIVAILSAFNLTLTLTSIAGLILTVGMAVDANVIIFERIKEEYRLGKSAEAAVNAGFRKAFWTVMDANITTFIAAIFLSQLGTGPIQGFAYTLAVGIVSSMFTALFVSRLVFDFSLDVLQAKKLSISWRKR